MTVLQQIEEHSEVVARLVELQGEIAEIAVLMGKCLAGGGKIIWMGNGGSAADSQHLAAEFVGRFRRERRALASIALTTDTSILTAVGNDYGFETIFSRQVEALCRAEDLVVGISTSGNSPNVVNGVDAANAIGAVTVGLTGEGGGMLRQRATKCLCVPSKSTARIQECHILVGHILCELLDK